MQYPTYENGWKFKRGHKTDWKGMLHAIAEFTFYFAFVVGSIYFFSILDIIVR